MPVAQSGLEHRFSKPQVKGSNPFWHANKYGFVRIMDNTLRCGRGNISSILVLTPNEVINVNLANKGLAFLEKLVPAPM